MHMVMILLNDLDMVVTEAFKMTNTFVYDPLRNGLTSQ